MDENTSEQYTNEQYINKWFTFSNIDQHIWYIKYGTSCTDTEMDHFILAYQNEFTKVIESKYFLK